MTPDGLIDFLTTGTPTLQDLVERIRDEHVVHNRVYIAIGYGDSDWDQFTTPPEPEESDTRLVAEINRKQPDALGGVEYVEDAETQSTGDGDEQTIIDSSLNAATDYAGCMVTINSGPNEGVEAYIDSWDGVDTLTFPSNSFPSSSGILSGIDYTVHYAPTLTPSYAIRFKGLWIGGDTHADATIREEAVFVGSSGYATVDPGSITGNVQSGDVQVIVDAATYAALDPTVNFELIKFINFATGDYEIREVSSKDGSNTITLASPLTYAYDDSIGDTIEHLRIATVGDMIFHNRTTAQPKLAGQEMLKFIIIDLRGQ